MPKHLRPAEVIGLPVNLHFCSCGSKGCLDLWFIFVCIQIAYVILVMLHNPQARSCFHCVVDVELVSQLIKPMLC